MWSLLRKIIREELNELPTAADDHFFDRMEKSANLSTNVLLRLERTIASHEKQSKLKLDAFMQIVDNLSEATEKLLRTVTCKQELEANALGASDNLVKVLETISTFKSSDRKYDALRRKAVALRNEIAKCEKEAMLEDLIKEVTDSCLL